MMDFEKTLMQNMACKLSNLINYNINIFDVNGIIVGSSDETRLGEYHEFAHKLIKGEIHNTKVYKPMSENVRPGVNLKIYSENKVIGAVGITGDPDKVEVFSKIIRLSLESLIQHKLYETKHRQIKKFEKQVVLDIIFNLSTEENIDKRLKILDFKIKNNFIIIKFFKNSYDSNIVFDDYQVLKAEMDNSIIYILSDDSIDHIKELKQYLKENKFRVIVSRVINLNMIFYEYIEQNILNDKKNYCFTGDYNLECFFNNLSNTKYNYLKLFNEAQKLINHEVLVKTFNAYVKYNLNSKKTAQVLYIHPNTLKYRIRKIENLTHCDLKNINDIIKLKISIVSLSNKK
jgi:carbohydrate diacid regulator